MHPRRFPLTTIIIAIGILVLLLVAIPLLTLLELLHGTSVRIKGWSILIETSLEKRTPIESDYEDCGPIVVGHSFSARIPLIAIGLLVGFLALFIATTG